MCPEYAQALEEMANLPTWFCELAETCGEDEDLFHNAELKQLFLASKDREALLSRVDNLLSRVEELSCVTRTEARRIRAAFGARTHVRKASRQLWLSRSNDLLRRDLNEEDAERAPPLTDVVAQPIVSHAPPAPTALGAFSRAA